MDDDNAFTARAHEAGGAGRRGPAGGLVPASPPDVLSASASLEVSFGECLPRVSASAHVPAAHVGALLQLTAYMVGAALVTITLVSIAVLGTPLWLAGPLALVEVAGCAYLLITRG